MIPVMQTKRGGYDVPPDERGDCLGASIASVLGLPEPLAIPWSDEHWWDTTQRTVREHGYALVVADTRIWPDTYWLASVPSLNLRGPDDEPLPHMIVMRDGEVAHDPALARRYEVGTHISALGVTDAYVLVPLAYEDHPS